MSLFTKALIIISTGFFLLTGIMFAFEGHMKAAGGAFLVFGILAFVGSSGWFFTRFRLPPMPPNSPAPNLFSEVKRFAEHYPGWPSRIACIFMLVIVGGMLLNLITIMKSIYEKL
ncbi:hypothetical protein ACFQUU_01155 [Herbaspirillum sp. GCM10030257]|uniref:hypothetical protein n=1 Tax=Herbaspirillum sp. GCM10030257 TaxID=3273393 RepID=UPI00362389C9